MKANKLKSNELRIGNYVYETNNLLADVSNWHFEKASLDNTPNEINVKPIPLTEEWLLKFGFEKIEITRHIFNKMGFDVVYSKSDLGIFHNKDLTIDFDGKTTSEMYFDVSFHFRNMNGIKKQIKHVHQLQNLFFALTGKELTIKE